MRTKSLVTISLVALLGLAIFGAYFAFGGSSAQAREADRHIVVTLQGLGLPVDTPDDVRPDADCFKTDLFDTRTGKHLGDGLDCLFIEEAATPGGPFLVDRTTVLNFKKGNKGRLVARGMTTVVPIYGSGPPSPLYTHVVGDVDPSTNNIVSGTKMFKKATGSVRLSGIVNLGAFPAEILFNCIFVIDLD